MYWVTKLFEYEYEIHYKNRKNNVVADALSRFNVLQLLQIALDTVSMDLLEEIKKSWDIHEKLGEVLTDLKNNEGGLGLPLSIPS